MVDVFLKARYASGPHLTYMYMCYYIYSESSDSSESSIEYFNGDVELPIVSRRNRIRTSSLHTVRAILDTPQDLVSTKHPTQININCAFVIDTSKLQDSGDTKCDDCGAWKQTKTATTILHLQFDEDGSVTSVKCCPNSSKKKYYTLVRCHYTCKSSPDLSRHISILSDPSGQQKPCQFI